VLSRIRICIPVFNNPATIERAVLDCLSACELPCVVVDDGSAPPVSLTAPAARAALDSGRLVVIRHPQNRGKGAALRTAFDDSLRLGYTHVLTLDGDGQHVAHEIPKLIRAVDNDPFALIIGERVFDAPHVPSVSKFGRKFSNFWVKYETGKPIRDSQCGMRVYPLFYVQHLRFWTSGYEFEIESLIRLMWRGVAVVEVPVQVIYPPAGERVSHFRKFKDNVRISLLNTLLVASRLTRLRPSATEAGLALGIGAFIGCTPLYGLHTILGAAVAVVFRLNAPLLILGTQVSIPPFVPFIVAASAAIGSRLLGIETRLWAWVGGSLVVGTLLGLALGLLGYVVVYLTRRPRKVVAWNGRMRGGVGNHFLKWVSVRFGLKPAYFLLYFIAPYFYLFAPKGRRGLHQYYRRITPEAGPLRRRFLVVAHMRRFGQLLLDRIAQSATEQALFQFRSTGFEYIQKCIDGKEGLILLSAHAGAWDLASSYVYQHQVQEPLNLVQYDPKQKSIHALLDKNEPSTPNILFSNRAPIPLLTLHRMLSEGKVTALLGDRPMAKHFELVPFFGQLAPFDTTAFKVAAATNKPLIFTFGFKGNGKLYDFFAAPPRRYAYESGIDRGVLTYQWASEFAVHLEGFLRRFPDQWANFFPFWSTRPMFPDAPRTADQSNAAATKPLAITTP
jgi:predicted LPLAT superfamily acyltransferase/glycosyltransferase involved in cell wall biosynthesis